MNDTAENGPSKLLPVRMDTVGQAVSSLSGRLASFSLAGRLALRSRYVDVRDYTYYIVGGLQLDTLD